MTRPLIVWHKNCHDGFAAAWVANRYFRGEADFHAAAYKEPPPDASGRHIFILDFSYPRGDLVTLAAKNHCVFVLDHHKTAAMDLALLPAVPPIWQWEDSLKSGFNFPLSATFDMERSGAGLAWDYFFPDQPRPALVEFVQDRDLWRFEHPGTRAVHSALASYPMDFETWDAIAARLDKPEGSAEMVAEGWVLDRMHIKRCREIIEQAGRFLVLDGHVIPVCAAPYAFASDIGNIMSEGYPFAATYVEHSGGITVSLRSQKEGGMDVSEIAKKFGGGGHRNAAGFTVSAPRGFPGVFDLP